MVCRFCQWIIRKFYPAHMQSDALWLSIYRWEDDYCDTWEVVDQDEDRRRSAYAASRLAQDDPAAALEQLTELADQGSPWAMLWVGQLYEGDLGVPRNAELAETFLKRAIDAGSWSARIRYVQLLMLRAATKEAASMLDDCIAEGFVPAMFWRAWYAFDKTPMSKRARRFRGVLEQAAEAGHPGARVVLARWAIKGYFGVREIPRGFGLIRRYSADIVGALEAAK